MVAQQREVMTADELLNMPAPSNETETYREAEYRRGYQDGFMEAVNAYDEIIFLRNHKRIYDALQSYWQGPLCDWAAQGSCQEMVPPPDVVVKCVYCGGPAEQMDHVTPKSRGGRTTLANLVPACRQCNMGKRARTPDEWRAAQRRTVE